MNKKDNIFQKEINRKKNSGGFSLKWESFDSVYPNYQIDVENSIPMWIADMDFPCPECVIDAVNSRAMHGLYGYSEGLLDEEFKEAASQWYKRRHGFDLNPDNMIFSPGIIPAVNVAIQEFTEKGEGVIVQPPVYYPFLDSIKNNKRMAAYNPLIDNGDKYVIDYENLEEVASDPCNKLMIFCSPHNPVGRVWTKDELEKVAQICLDNDVILFSDEIHCDLIMEGRNFISMFDLTNVHENLILAHAPSKTFNTAGLQASVITSPNEKLKTGMKERFVANGIPEDNIFAEVGGIAAYNGGDEYADQLMIQIEKNVDYAFDIIKNSTKGIRMYKPEGTFLIWIDFRDTGKSNEEITRYLLEEVKVIGDAGEWFGPGGGGHMRFNFACPQSYIKAMMSRFEKYFK